MKPKQTLAQMNESDRARYFEAHAGDMSLWSDRPARVKTAPDSRTGFVIAVDDDTVDRLQELAGVEGIDIIELIERWVAQKLQERDHTPQASLAPRKR